jgi:regulator of RNase E activity RraB
VLYPSEEDIERIKNREVLEVLKRNGDSLESARDILHWAYFKTAGERSDFGNSAQALGYRIDSESEFTEKDNPYGICVRKKQDIQSDALDEAVIDLFRAAKRANGEYDGWESPVITG